MGWVLIGGLMVALHAHAAGLEPARATEDVDALLHVETLTLSKTDNVLKRLGYEFHESASPSAKAHRWIRDCDGAVMDLLVPDRHSTQFGARFRQRDAVGVPRGRSVIDNHLTETLIEGDPDVRFAVPTVAGAIVLKAAAHRADDRDRARHLDDLAVLIAAMPDISDIEQKVVQRSDLKCIRDVIAPLGSHLADATSEIRIRAAHRLRTLADVVRFEGELPGQPTKRKGRRDTRPGLPGSHS